jgi:hypothetical protein
MMQEFFPKAQTDPFIEKLSVSRLKYLEGKYNEYLEQQQMEDSDDSTADDCSTEHLLEILNTRDKITCRINRLTRQNSLSPTRDNKDKYKDKDKNKKVSFITPTLQLSPQELFCGYAYNNLHNKCSEKECGCLVMSYAHAEFPPVKLHDLCSKHKKMECMVHQYQHELTQIINI